jgi:hypothetical protein
MQGQAQGAENKLKTAKKNQTAAEEALTQVKDALAELDTKKASYKTAADTVSTLIPAWKTRCSIWRSLRR